jgi:hypothetical protein
MELESCYVRVVYGVEMADKENYAVGVHKIKKTYELETLLTYYPADGGKGWVIKIKEKK